MIMLVLLVSFVTSIATGIVTVTLVNQAPPPITSTINRVVEKTVETITPEDFGKKTVVVTEEDRIIGIVREVAPAVVSVIASKDVPVFEDILVDPFGSDDLLREFFPDLRIPQRKQTGTERREISSGSGFFVTTEGMLLTNKHVVADATADYTLILNTGEKIAAEVLARDPFQDLAILKAKQQDRKRAFTALPLGDSGALEVGQTVIAVGNALGEFNNTVSVGIISGLDRNIVAEGSAAGPEELRQLIQTDAAVNPGNSGGPLISLRGQVIGINTAIARSAENIGFALPINIARRHVSDIEEYGAIKYPYLGIRYQSVAEGIKLVKGPAGEAAVDPKGPAAQAGLKEGDVIKLSASGLIDLLNSHRVGEKVNLQVLRNNGTIIVAVTLGERPKNV